MSEARPQSRRVGLCILDGWGWREASDANAVRLADTPVFDSLFGSAPSCFLRTDGSHVGLPDGQFGNSEVGHMNLGAGRIVMQDLPRIDAALEDGSLAASSPFRALVDAARAGSGRVHLLGLLSPGGVHSHQNHLAALCRMLAAEGLDVRVHAFTDGRDTPPRSARGYIERFNEMSDEAQIATVCGRYFAMDRDRRWERTAEAFHAIVYGRGKSAATADLALEQSHTADRSDEFVHAHVVAGYGGLEDGDTILCANFRADRVRQLLDALSDPSFDGFDREGLPQLSTVAGMTSYSDALDARMITLFEPQRLNAILGAVLADAGRRQLRMAETEKYPHVTFFFNGGREVPFEQEDRILVPSPKVATYDLQPSMSAVELTDRCVERLRDDPPDFLLINFANPDMVGHTGDLDAAIRAVETVDHCLGRLLKQAAAAQMDVLVTADHGNCELMIDPETGGPHTAHTTNPVPCMLVTADGERRCQLSDGRLADVAPTLLQMLGLQQPLDMTGTSLLRNA